MSYLQVYRKMCASFDGNEKRFEERCHELFEEALKNGDRRMAMELQDVIVTAAEVGAPVNVIVKDYDLLVRNFPDIAAQTLEILLSMDE